MLPLFKVNKRMTITLAGVVLAAGFVCYYFLHVPDGEGNRSLIPQEAEVVKQDTKIKISADTDIVQRILYLKCNDEEELRTKATDSLIGLNYFQVQKMYSGWNIDKFDNHEVVMSLKVDSYCREHANNMFIGIKDGYVAVFNGKPGSKAIVKEVTKIAVDKLHPQDVEELKRGMVVKSREELLRTLEGLQSK
ncbi:MAG: BofC C-terminal domain-containing protein [Veillonellales bacterium]